MNLASVPELSWAAVDRLVSTVADAGRRAGCPMSRCKATSAIPGRWPTATGALMP